MLDETLIIDPSYDVHSLRNKYYFDNVKDFNNTFRGSLSLPKDIITKFIRFIKYAEEINNGQLLVCDKEFYNNQADYVEQKLKNEQKT